MATTSILVPTAEAALEQGQGTVAAATVSKTVAALLTEYFGIKNKQAKARMSGEIALRLTKPFDPALPARKQGFESVVMYLWVNESLAGGTTCQAFAIELFQQLSLPLTEKQARVA